jgi:hypothetical protein
MNKKLSNNLKGRNNQILSLQEENKHLKKVNKNDKLDETHNLKEQLEDVTRHLTNRDNEFKVSIDYLNYEKLINHPSISGVTTSPGYP